VTLPVYLTILPFTKTTHRW